MSGRLWCAFNREGLAITSTLTHAGSQPDAETAIFQKFAYPRPKMESIGVCVAPAMVVEVVKDNSQ